MQKKNIEVVKMKNKIIKDEIQFLSSNYAFIEKNQNTP